MVRSDQALSPMIWTLTGLPIKQDLGRLPSVACLVWKHRGSWGGGARRQLSAHPFAIVFDFRDIHLNVLAVRRGA